MSRTEPNQGKIPVEDLQNWVVELEAIDAPNDVIGNFFYDHLKRNAIDLLKEGKSIEQVFNVMVSEGEKILKRTLSQTEKDDLKRRVEVFKKRINQE